MGGIEASVDVVGLARLFDEVESLLVALAALGFLLALERVDLVIVKEAETFRLSSFAAALRLNDLKRFKLERSQPHNLVTCQPRHDEVVVAVGANLCDRSTQFETSF